MNYIISEAAGFWVLSVDIAANDAADANVLVRLCQHQHQQNRIALYSGKHLHSSSTCTTTAYITQVSLKDGWVDQEAAVIHGVDNAVRGAKVSLGRTGYKCLCLFVFLSSCNIFLSGCGCNQHGRWVGGGLQCRRRLGELKMMIMVLVMIVIRMVMIRIRIVMILIRMMVIRIRMVIIIIRMVMIRIRMVIIRTRMVIIRIRMVMIITRMVMIIIRMVMIVIMMVIIVASGWKDRGDAHWVRKVAAAKFE